MANMGYCMFNNTLKDLQDCYEVMDDPDILSEEERKAQKKLIHLCGDIAADFDDGEDDE